MMITLKPEATKEDFEKILARIKEFGFTPHVSHGEEVANVIGVIGHNVIATKEVFEAYPFVEAVMPISKPYKLVSREFRKADTKIDLGGGVMIGGKTVIVMAGPCSIEGREKLWEVSAEVKKSGAHVLRGGAFKPRTSPYAFQGMGEEGLKLLQEAGREFKMPTVTEVMAPSQVELVCLYADVLQIGARNIQNFDLLKEVGKARKPVLLKRGLATSVQELLMSAEYIVSNGNQQVMFCERGIRTFETSTRFTLDLNAVPVIKHLSHLPVVVDPSHGVGVRDFIPPLCLAAVACGADGLMIEVHPRPEEALSDGAQALLPKPFAALMDQMKKVAVAIGRDL